MHCTQDVLLKTVDDWRASLDLGKLVGSVMIDLSKAFDSINHQALLQKLNKYGVHGGELQWFTDYLNHRRQRVLISGASSDWNHVHTGVPQGTILGPLLFSYHLCE